MEVTAQCMLLAGGKLSNVQILKPETVALMNDSSKTGRLRHSPRQPVWLCGEDVANF
jgi:hypothetical protein